mgnify:CR=1 FL=1
MELHRKEALVYGGRSAKKAKARKGISKKKNENSKGAPKKAKDKICANCTKVQPLMKQCARCKLVHYCCRDWKVEHSSLHKIHHPKNDGNREWRFLPLAPLRTRS